MILRVSKATYIKDYTLRVMFNNGIEGDVDLADELDGEVFGALCDIRLFKRFTIDPVLGTIAWENGADLAPEFLFENLRIPA